MDEVARKLLDAHVQYELDRLTGENANRVLEQEAGAFHDWVKGLRLDDIAGPEMINDIIRRYVVDRPVPGGVAAIAGEMSRLVLGSPHNERTTLADILPPKLYTAFVDKGVSIDAIRENTVRLTVQNPAFRRLVADLLLSVIREYVFEENVLARRVPGVSRAFKLYASILGRTVPVLSEFIEHQLRESIERNLDTALSHTEKSLRAVLSEDRLAELADSRYAVSASKPLSRHFAAIDPLDLEDFVVLGLEFWLNFRKTEYFRSIYTDIVNSLFAMYGEQEVEVLLEDLDVTREEFVTQFVDLVGPALQTARQMGYLEERLRAWMTNFYDSDAAAAILGQAAGPAEAKAHAATPAKKGAGKTDSGKSRGKKTGAGKAAPKTGKGTTKGGGTKAGN
ncbi:MAG: hypothetical protein ACLFOY_01505 [Desulfatibacillaceae bacterium]